MYILLPLFYKEASPHVVKNFSVNAHCVRACVAARAWRKINASQSDNVVTTERRGWEDFIHFSFIQLSIALLGTTAAAQKNKST